MLKFLLVLVLIIIMKNMNLMISMTILMLLFNFSLQTNLNAKISTMFTGDLISFWITNMSLMVFFILTLVKQKKTKMYNKMMMTMAVVLVAAFNNWNFMMYYMLFEVSMIIILMVIILWGYQPERAEAMMFMIIMTLTFSLPFMVAMMKNSKTLNFWFIEINSQLMVFLSFTFIFMMKMPIYFTHFWLPKAHVEAPAHGSMILAAILLKLGCYGMMRMNFLILKFNKIKPIMIAASSLSMIILSANCIMQTDLKTLIAYSSIVHMTTVFMNIIMMKMKSIYSSMIIIVGHGLCAASMFFMANIMYLNSKSRSILLNKGIMTLMPAMTLMWFTTCMNNAPMPPSMNMMGELMAFKNLLSWSNNTLYPTIIMIALTSSMYSIYLFCPPGHGMFSKLTNKLKLNTTNSTIIITMMVTPISLITIKPAMLIT